MTHTVLVIDSEPTQLELLCAALKENLGYHAIGVTSCHEATRYAMTAQLPKPDLMLFDISTVAEGSNTTTNLRMLAAHTPIVALVKYGDYAAATAALNNGAQDFLTKPVAAERLGTTLRNVLRLCDAQREASYLRHKQMHGADTDTHHNGADSLNILQSFSLLNEDGNIRRMEQIEAEAIRFAMQYYKGRMTEVARRLGIGRSTLYRKLNEFSSRQQQAA